LTILAGEPTDNELEGMSDKTRELAPIQTLSPIFTPPINLEPVAM